MAPGASRAHRTASVHAGSAPSPCGRTVPVATRLTDGSRDRPFPSHTASRVPCSSPASSARTSGRACPHRLHGYWLLRGHLPNQRRVAFASRFAGVVCLAGDALFFPLRGTAGTFEHLSQPRSHLVDGLSSYPRSPLRLRSGQHEASHDCPLGADGCYPPIFRPLPLIN